MKAWWTAEELALQTLPGLPTTKRKVNAMAADLGWSARSDASGMALSRARKGKGGGTEYHYTVLPVSAVAALVARGQVMNLNGASQPVAGRSELWAAFDGLPEAKKAVARFRLDVLKEAEALCAAGYSKTGAAAHVVQVHGARHRAGEGDQHKFSVQTLGNWQKAVRHLSRGDCWSVSRGRSG